MKRVLAAVTLAVVALFALTACNPPMPPSVAAQIAEQTYTCIDGEAQVSFPESMASLASEWQMSMQTACTDTVMSFTSAEAANADIILSAYPVTACTPVSTVPVAIEAADVAFSLSVSTTLYLSPKTLSGIFNGDIANWSDQAIAKENPETQMPDQPIILRNQVDKLAFKALKGFAEHYGSPINKAFEESVFSAATVEPLADGEIALMPHSISLEKAFSTASFIQAPIDGLDQLANADTMSIMSGGTQWVPKQDGDDVSVSLDYSIAPQVLDGMDTASPPYQLIYPVFLNICHDTLLSRATAFFFLRLDSQGSLGVSVFTQLPENTRVVSLVAVKRGLPVPTATPTQ